MYFQKPAFGLDISDYSIEILQLNKSKKAKSFSRLTLETGIIKDGIILDKEKLSQKIKQVLLMTKIKSSRVILALPESKVFTHLISLPNNLKDKDLSNAIVGEIAKTIPIESDDLYWDYQILEKNSSGQQIILFIGTLTEIIDDYLEVLDNTGLEPIVFEIESIALARAILDHRKITNSVMIIDIGARTTNINIFDKRKTLRLSTMIPVAGLQLTKALAENLKISLKEAERLKIKHGFDETETNIETTLKNAFQPIILEIEKNLQYYSTQNNNPDIPKEIFVAGGTALMPGLIDYLSIKLKPKIELGLSPVAEQLNERSVLYNAVIGLALRAISLNPENNGINLLPVEARPKPSFVDKKIRENNYFKYLGALFGLTALIILGWVFYAFIIKNIFLSRSFEIIPSNSSKTEQTGSIIEQNTQIDIQATSTQPNENQVVNLPIPIQNELATSSLVVIQTTETGWLNVRAEAGTDFVIIDKVFPGESYVLLEKKDNWYKIELKDKKVGWISAKYANIK